MWGGQALVGNETRNQDVGFAKILSSSYGGKENTESMCPNLNCTSGFSLIRWRLDSQRWQRKPF
jgi:hypothetical protein